MTNPSTDPHSPEGNNVPTIDGLVFQLKELEETIETRMRSVEVEVAQRRNYEKVAVLLGYAAIAFIAILGLIGYSSVSDIDSMVRDRIDYNILQTHGERAASIGNIEKYKEDFDSLVKDLDEAKQIWFEEIEPAIKGLSEIDPSGDLQQRFQEIDAAIDDSSAIFRLREGAEGSPSSWRRRATKLIQHAIDDIEKANIDPAFISQFSPDDIFNLAQLSRRLARYDLVRNLTKAALQSRPNSAASKALYLQSEARRYNPETKDAFKQLLDLVRNLSMDNPHIVIAEAWNASEVLRQYTSLINAIDTLIDRNREDASIFLPSFALAKKGGALLRRGLPGDVEKAVDVLADAVVRVKTEGIHTQWASATVQEVLELAQALFAGGAETKKLDLAVERSGIGSLKQHYFLLSIEYRSLPDSQG